MPRRLLPTFALVILFLCSLPAGMAGQDSVYFTARQDAGRPILDLIAGETVRIDVATWWFSERTIADALIRRHRAGVHVRVIGDANTLRDAGTKGQLDYLASNGIRIRLRSPQGGGGLMHWKCGIFAAQDAVAFGSANWTPFSLRPYSTTNYIDDSVLVTRDAHLVPAFKMQFDRMWVDTTSFADYANITSGSRVRLEPDAVLPSSTVWAQGTDYNRRLIAEIDEEPSFIDLVAYRLIARSVTDALVRRARAGVRVRLVVDPVQYRHASYPEASGNLDLLWANAITIKRRIHQGMTHMKTIVTSSVASEGSSNITDTYHRDHNYFIDRVSFPTLYQRYRDRVGAMLADTAGFADFYPQPPGSVSLVGPSNGRTGISVTPALDWSDAHWATNYDVQLGTSPASLTTVARQVPHSTVVLTSPLRAATTYYWRVRARTNATSRDSRLATLSATWSFVTTANPGPVAAAPEVALYAARATARSGGWTVVADASAAGGSRMYDNGNTAKITTPLASPAHYFELRFYAEAGRPYRIWIRGKADGNSYENDSVWAQFSGSRNAAGAAAWRIGSTSGISLSVEQCSGCGVSGWGWHDNGWGTGVRGEPVYFATSGVQTVRIQRRQDGVSIDQVVLSPQAYFWTAPGAAKSDATILQPSGAAAD